MNARLAMEDTVKFLRSTRKTYTSIAKLGEFFEEVTDLRMCLGLAGRPVNIWLVRARFIAIIVIFVLM
jgi:hypothetical protein